MGILQARVLEWLVMLSSRGLTQGLNLSLLHCRQITTEPPGKPQPYAYMNSKWAKQMSKNKAITSTFFFIYRRNIQLSKKRFVRVFLYDVMGKPKQIFWPTQYYCWDGEVFLCVIRILKVMWKMWQFRLIQIKNSNSYHKQSLKYEGLGIPWQSSG